MDTRILSSLFIKKQDINMKQEIETQQDTSDHLLDKLSVGDVISSFCHHNGTYTTVTDSNGNEVCCKCRKPLAK